MLKNQKYIFDSMHTFHVYNKPRTNHFYNNIQNDLLRTGSLESFHTLSDTYLDRMLGNLNQIVWSEMYKLLSFMTKSRVFKKHFWQSVDAILQDVSVAETIVQW